MYQFTSAFVTSFNVSAKSRTQWQLHFELKNVLFHCCFVKYTIVRQSQGQGKSTLWALLLIQQTEWKYAIIRKTVNSFLHSVWSLASIPWLQASKKQLTLSIFSSFHGLPWNSPCPGHTDIMHTYFRMAILQTLLCKLDCTYKDAHRPCTNNLTIPQQRLQSLPASVTSITRILILNDHISHHFSLHCASQLLCGVSVPRGWIFVVIIVRVYHASHIAFLTRSLGCTVWKEADAGITAMQLWSNMHGDLFGRHFKTMAVECEIKKDSDEKDTHTHTHTLLIYITGTHTHTNAHTHTGTPHMYTHTTDTHVHTHTRAYKHTNAPPHTKTYKYTHVYTCTHMLKCKHANAHPHTKPERTPKHAYTHHLGLALSPPAAKVALELAALALESRVMAGDGNRKDMMNFQMTIRGANKTDSKPRPPPPELCPSEPLAWTRQRNKRRKKLVTAYGIFTVYVYGHSNLIQTHERSTRMLNNLPWRRSLKGQEWAIFNLTNTSFNYFIRNVGAKSRRMGGFSQACKIMEMG